MKKSTCLRGLALLLVLLLSVVPLSACQTAEKPAVSETPETQPAAFDASTLTQERMLEDYDYMWKVLEENYPFFEVCKRVYGVDAQQVKEEYRAKLAFCINGDVLGLDSMLMRCLQEFHFAGHLEVLEPDIALQCAEYAEKLDPDGTDPEMQMQSCCNNEKSIATYRWIKEKTDPGYSQSSVYDTTADAAQYVDSVFSVTEADGVPVFTFSSFGGGSTQATTDAYIAQVCAAMEKYINADNLILDVRGNGGGNTSIWQDGLLPYLDSTELIQHTVAAYKDGAWNRHCWGRDLASDPEFQTSDTNDLDFLSRHLTLDHFAAEDLAAMDRLIVGEELYTCGTASRQFHGKLWILQDARDASSTEVLIRLAKDSGFATLVGERSGGLGGIVTSPATCGVTLPNSGIVFRYVPFYVFNSDGSCQEVGGTTPDIECASADALDVCLQAIKGQP